MEEKNGSIRLWRKRDVMNDTHDAMVCEVGKERNGGSGLHG